MSWLLVGAGIGLVIAGFGWALLRIAALADRRIEAVRDEWLAEDDPRRTWNRI